jgi:hypothetical protein
MLPITHVTNPTGNHHRLEPYGGTLNSKKLETLLLETYESQTNRGTFSCRIHIAVHIHSDESGRKSSRFRDESVNSESGKVCGNFVPETFESG